MTGSGPASKATATGWRAAVDLGSASTQLLLTDGATRITHTVDTMMGGITLAPTGETTAATISPEALDRVAAALRGFAELIHGHAGGDSAGCPIRVLGTAGARQATNTDALAGLVATTLRAELEVIDAAAEARLSFLGAASDPATVAARPLVTLDIGGGSTELALGRGSPEITWSMPMGGVVLTDAYLLADPPKPEELSAALSVVELYLDDLRREEPELAAALADGPVVGLGAVVTVAAIEVGGAVPAGFVLSRGAVEDVFRTIATEPRADRMHNPGLPAARVDAIVGACALLVEAMRQFDLTQVIVSEYGLLDGAVQEVARRAGRTRLV